MIGINDFLHGTTCNKVLAFYEQIIDRLKKNKKLRIIVQSTLYVSPSYASMLNYKNLNKKASLLNKELQQLCVLCNLTFLDLNRTLSATVPLILCIPVMDYT